MVMVDHRNPKSGGRSEGGQTLREDRLNVPAKIKRNLAEIGGNGDLVLVPCVLCLVCPRLRYDQEI